MTEMKLKAVFFDLDGTLLDTAQDLSNALNRLLEKKRRPRISEDAMRKVVSDGAYAMLKLAFGVERDDPQTAGLRSEFLDLYSQDLSSKTTVFPGINELIYQLHINNIQWGIVTNKPEPYTVPLMKRFTFASDPVCLICPENVTKRKPDPEPLVLACRQADCQHNAAIYVGDHLRDIQCGQNAKIKTIAVNYGYISQVGDAYSWGADHVVETGHGIWQVLESYVSPEA